MERIRNFLKLESAGGITLVAAAVLAMVAANSPLAPFYNLLLDTPLHITAGPLKLHKPLLLWINDGLMAVFFLLVGLELKREFLDGELSDRRKVALPLFGAAGGMLAPSLIYAWLNRNDPAGLAGWAIPAATDIAFALGILSLLGNRIPNALKVFLVSVAIFDDLGAILIIAFFYTGHLSLGALGAAALFAGCLWLLNRRGVTAFAPYAIFGLLMWVAVLKSGVHATLAGVALALFVPFRSPGQPGVSPLRRLEHRLHFPVAFLILPLFAFANSGLSLAGIGPGDLLHPVPAGIAAGLFFGKQIGVMGFCMLGVKLGVARLPSGVGWGPLYGVALLCGVGFTMSLFIGSLAFEQTGIDRVFDERLGILIGSLCSGLAGYLYLDRITRRHCPA
jgi:NhaA family Na+:H+ antiporter